MNNGNNEYDDDTTNHNDYFENDENDENDDDGDKNDKDERVIMIRWIIMMMMCR